LPDAYGTEVSLKTLLAKGSASIVASGVRTATSNYMAYRKRCRRSRNSARTPIAISPEKPDHGIVLTEKNKLTFPVLSDFGNKVARQFGIVFQLGAQLKEFSKNVFKNDVALRNGEDSYELPVPATYVVDTKGIIRFAHADEDYMTGRAEPEAVMPRWRRLCVRSLTKSFPWYACGALPHDQPVR
jgi:peroxiredoxin